MKKNKEDVISGGVTETVVFVNLSGNPSAVLSVKKEMLCRWLEMTKVTKRDDICLHSSVKSEAVALMRQIHYASHSQSSAEADAMLTAIYQRLREKLVVIP